MKKFYSLFLASAALLMVSCMGGTQGSSLSKGDLLDYIVASKGVVSETVTFPEKLKSRTELDSKYCNYTLMSVYAENGLVNMRDTTVSYKQWGTWKSYNAVDSKLTQKGLESVVESTDAGTKVLQYKYEFNKIVDIELLSRRVVEEANAEILSYVAFYTGKVVEATPFITVFDVKVGDTYPFGEGADATVMATRVTAVFRDGDLISIKTSGAKSIKKSEMEDYYNEVWLDQIY